MKRKKTVIGEKFGENFGQSQKGDALKSKAASHGDVFTGELADKALGAIGARAMTMDGEIIVNSNFDLSTAEDQSLYAHELYHKAKSGGAAGDKIRDAEEIIARSVESMVFHRADGGHADALPGNIADLFQQAEQASAPAVAQDAAKSGSQTFKEDSGTPSASRGYAALRGQGMSHDEVIRMLVELLVKQEEESKDDRSHRGGTFKGFTQ
jgi:hypothetical protein